MKTLYVDQINPDTGKLVDYFLVTQVERKEAKNAKPYLSLKLRDKTGEVDAKFWDVPADLGPVAAGDFVKVEALTGEYRDALQLKVTRLRVLPRAEVSLDDFMPASKRDRDEMLFELGAVIDTLSDAGLKMALLELVEDFRSEIRNAPAARKLHQAYLGGLLEHMLNLCHLVDSVCAVYGELNRDVLMAGMIVHDIGKIEEYVYVDHLGTSRSGHLIGHIIQGSILWHQYSGTLDPVIRDHVAHIIASHHGQKSWGAPVVPMSREAQVAHCLDLIDSRMAIVNEALATAQFDADGFTPRINALDTALWNGGTSAVLNQ